MREEKGPLAFIHRLLGLEQPYGAGPDYDNPDKGPFSMTGGWERTTAAGTVKLGWRTHYATGREPCRSDSRECRQGADHDGTG